ncbi:conserved hypothetical protein (plasmid) [Allorhizobium ampelinum S4]|uniref:TauD/TfdA-like domain-containing protein n=1 Tax=Allorhizobium ampelinum (strain ATCC BAA-846 / DSM 112012 / S4) TaxID=311402 RepID=B9K395_ALLAM|nr:conserved hypothetical protein [Allorhizobium ampelinum S4]
MDTHELTHKEFPLPNFGLRLHSLTKELENGLGFRLIKGLPINDKDEAGARLISWGLGLYIGVALPQNSDGALIHDVRDRGETSAATLRGNGTSEEIQFHIDPCDVVALFCRRSAAVGGQSRLCSSIEIHNRLAMEDPDLLEVLYSMLPFASLGSAPPDAHVYNTPVFGWKNGLFTSHFYRARIIHAGSLPSVNLSPEQRRAVDRVSEIASNPDMYLEMNLEPGDLQLVNNHILYHARSSYEDYPDPDLRRHLFRLWFSVPDSRELPDEFAGFWGTTEAGSVRGGVRSWQDKYQHVSRYQKAIAEYHGMAVAKS